MEIQNNKEYSLSPGTKYLVIDLSSMTLKTLVDALNNGVKLAVFPNKEKKTDKHPDFKGKGMAVWINTYTGVPKTGNNL